MYDSESLVLVEADAEVHYRSSDNMPQVVQIVAVGDGDVGKFFKRVSS